MALARDCLLKAERSNLVEEVALCVAVHDRHYPAAASGGERLPAAAWPRVRDVEPEIRDQPPGTVTPSPP